MKCQVRRLSPQSILPQKAGEFWLLSAPADVLLPSQQRTPVSLGVELDIPSGVRVSLRSAPTLPSKFTTQSQEFYAGPTGELVVGIHNSAVHWDDWFGPYAPCLRRGTVVATLLFTQLADVELTEVEQSTGNDSEKVEPVDVAVQAAPPPTGRYRGGRRGTKARRSARSRYVAR